MIGHFLKRDFQDALTSWIIVSILSSLFLVAYILTPSQHVIFGLGYVFFMFSIFQVATLIGNIARADHIISRQYFLALPASRNSLFFILILRILVFSIPLWLYFAVIAPLTLRQDFAGFINSAIGYLIYLFGVSVGILWFLTTALLQTLIIERSLHHSSSRRRLLSGIIPAFVAALGFGLLLGAFTFALRIIYQWGESTNLIFAGSLVLVCLLVPTLQLMVSVKLAKSRWTSVS